MKPNKSLIENGECTAPYNFISLNHEVVEDPNRADLLSYDPGLLSGCINLKITNSTPVFIRGKGDEFYKAGEQYAIPGSSMRGMIRTLMEIITWSRFGFLKNELHFLWFLSQ